MPDLTGRIEGEKMGLFGKDYKEGFIEGLQTAKQQKKVKFQFKHLSNYLVIEIDLIKYTFDYIKDWFSRKLFKK